MRPADGDLAQFFDRSPIGIFRASDAGRFLLANPTLVHMLGYGSAEELMEIDLWRDLYVDPDARKALLAHLDAGRVVEGVKLRWRRKDGREIDVRAWGERLAGTPMTSQGWIIDVTAAEAAQADLQRAATTLDLVMRQVSGVYWRIDCDQRVVESGGALREVVGYTESRFNGMTLGEQRAIDPPSFDSRAHHARALAGEVTSFDTEYRGRQLSSTVGPLRDTEGAIVGAIGTAIDVTRARELERRMIDAQRAESLGVLAGGLAHDFNNLLVAVIGSAELALREVKAGAPGRSAIENIRDAGLRAAELTGQLLAYAGHAGAGDKRVAPAPLVEELLRIVAPTMSKDVSVTVDIPGALALRGDPAQVRQVLLNLLANARDAIGSARGTIAIRAREVEHDGAEDADVVLAAPPGAYLLLEVADDGPGFDVETRRHVFEPFYTTKTTGHGLGLAAVLGIVRAHGGGIRVHSEPGLGARFEVLWPASHERPRPPTPRSVTPPTVLVVDDEDLVRDVLVRMVEELGYVTRTARDGTTALALVDRESIDVVLLDLTMPHMSGADVLAALRARKPTLPVVLCSGFDRDGRGPVRADAYLPKPFRIEALERTLAKVLPLRSV